MGCGSYSYNDAVARSHSYRSQSIEKTFSKKNLDPEMNPLNINFRESCDSKEHPESFLLLLLWMRLVLWVKFLNTLLIILYQIV